MRQFKQFVLHFYEQSQSYFSLFQEDIVMENLYILQRAALIYEVILMLYCGFALYAFQNTMLNDFYFFFITLNTIYCALFLRYKKQNQLTYRRVQRSCWFFLFQVMAFIIGISIFPFPTRPAIFYSPIYLLLMMLFQFPLLSTFFVSTGVNVFYIASSLYFKDIHASVYDVTAAITTWLLGIVLMLLLTSLRIRSGEAKMSLQQSSRTDFLTGLANRREMDRQFHNVYAACKARNVEVSMFMLDVDYFKRYNDRFGHEAGDSCLAYVGKTIKSYIEEKGYFAARYGGEEFVILLPGCDHSTAVKEANELFDLIRIQNPLGDIETFSMGIAVEVPSQKSSLNNLIQKADIALYRAKESGRNQYVMNEN